MENSNFDLIIFSSTQSIPIAEELKQKLEDCCSCETWNSCFMQGENFLSSLMSFPLVYDACILICGADDVTLSKNVCRNTPRDNVIFEMGLYIGLMGTERAMVLVQDGVKLPSDLEGYCHWRFPTKNENKDSFIDDRTLKQLKACIDELSRLPQRKRISSAVAINYFNNFVAPLVSYVHRREPVRFGDNVFKCKRIRIMLPPSLSVDVQQYAERALCGYEKITLPTKDRKDFMLHYKKLKECDAAEIPEIEICDFPFIFRMCGVYLSDYFCDYTKSVLKKKAEAKEIYNFKLLLELKLKNLLGSESFVVFSAAESGSEPFYPIA